MGTRRQGVRLRWATGTRTLDELFDGRGQLVVYHAMFNPDTASDKRPGRRMPCKLRLLVLMDNFDNVVVHLNHRDITMAAVSLAPVSKLEAYRKRVGWSFPWYSSKGSDFNFDYNVSLTPEQLEAGAAEYNYRVDPVSMSEAPGISVFRPRPARFTTPIRPTRAGSTWSTSPITTWTRAQGPRRGRHGWNGLAPPPRRAFRLIGMGMAI
jgi:predicted dithiol-disulfide oxidoreductase (DUF899 family)